MIWRRAWGLIKKLPLQLHPNPTSNKPTRLAAADCARAAGPIIHGFVTAGGWPREEERVPGFAFQFSAPRPRQRRAWAEHPIPVDATRDPVVPLDQAASGKTVVTVWHPTSGLYGRTDGAGCIVVQVTTGHLRDARMGPCPGTWTRRCEGIPESGLLLGSWHGMDG